MGGAFTRGILVMCADKVPVERHRDHDARMLIFTSMAQFALPPDLVHMVMESEPGERDAWFGIRQECSTKVEVSLCIVVIILIIAIIVIILIICLAAQVSSEEQRIQTVQRESLHTARHSTIRACQTGT